MVIAVESDIVDKNVVNKIKVYLYLVGILHSQKQLNIFKFLISTFEYLHFMKQ